MFSRFYMRQMEAEELYESLLVATAADNAVPKDRSEEMKDRWLRQFSQAFGTDDNAEATTFNGSIPQALTLMNGELMRRATDLPRENPRAAARAGRRGPQSRAAETRPQIC